MKKLLSLALCLVMALTLALTGCGNKTEDSSSGSTTGDYSNMKIGFIMSGMLGDKSYFDDCYKGLKELESKYGVKLNYAECSYKNDKFQPAFRDYAEDEYDIILCMGLADEMIPLAKEYSNQDIWYVDGPIDNSSGTLDNVYACRYLQNECSYLAGIVSGGMSKNHVMGVVLGGDGEIMNDFVLAYVEGAQSVVPETKCHIAIINSFIDVAKAKEVSLTMIAGKADVLYQVAGQAGWGAFDAIAEKGGWAIGVNVDEYEILKNDGNDKFANVVITSAVKEVRWSIIRAFDKHVNNELDYGITELLGVKKGGASIAKNEKYEKDVPADLKAKVEAAEKAIKDGDLKVITAYGKSTDEIQALRNSFKP